MKDETPKNEILLKTKQDTISEGISFLLEMEQVNSAPVQNALILNIFKVSDHIQDAQILADQEGRKMLIFLKLGFWGRLRHQGPVAEDVIMMLREVLPTFSFRVVYDYPLFEKGLKIAQKLAHARAKLGPRF